MRTDTPSSSPLPPPGPPRREPQPPAARAEEMPQPSPHGFSDWLASLSHELRTPLNAIIGYADLLLLGLPRAIPDESKLQVDRMRLAARHLLQRLDEILTFACLEAGQETPRWEEVSVSQLVRETAAALERQAAGRPVRVMVSLPSAPITIRSDNLKLRQALGYLGAHAVGRTERGTVTLAARTEADAVIIEVRDTGPGMSPDRVAKLFDPLWQAGAASEPGLHRESSNGATLGLTIAWLLTRLIGGEIVVRSREGIGSTFVVRLPLRGD